MPWASTKKTTLYRCNKLFFTLTHKNQKWYYSMIWLFLVAVRFPILFHFLAKLFFSCRLQLWCMLICRMCMKFGIFHRIQWYSLFVMGVHWWNFFWVQCGCFIEGRMLCMNVFGTNPMNDYKFGFPVAHSHFDRAFCPYVTASPSACIRNLI